METQTLLKQNTNYKGIPALTPSIVHEYLYEIGTKWTGKGVAIELGSWLGATALPLLEGLVKAGYNEPFFAYDRWTATEEQIIHAQQQNVSLRIGEDLTDRFLANICPTYKRLVVHKGDIVDTIKQYPKFPIEICLFDAPKTGKIFFPAMEVLLKHFIPGVTVFGMLDYYFYRQKNGMKFKKAMQPVQWIQDHSSNFERIAEWPNKCDCVFFKYIKKIG